jgi:hypothetical protein
MKYLARQLYILRLLGWGLVALMLVGCGEASPTTTGDTLPFPLQPTATPTAPYVAVNNVTPTVVLPNSDQTINALVATPTFAPSPTLAASPTAAPTPIFAPTPVTPQQGFFMADDLGVTEWSSTGVSWSPQGDQLILHVNGTAQDNSFYYLIRPPNSHVADYKLANSTFDSLSWSPDGRYFSYIDKDAAGNAGPVKLVDTLNAPTTPRQLFKGPCTGAIWMKDGRLAATCGLAVYDFVPTSPATDTPDVLFKLNSNHFPNSDIPLTLLVRAVPSPDGTQLALLALRSTGNQTTQTEAGVYNLSTKSFVLLEHNNRPFIFSPNYTWTPDGKYVVLRNWVSDWAVPYTFDYYLADASKGRLQGNLTRTNPTCDPLQAKADCQGINPSSQQSDQIFFAPDGKRYLFTSQKFVSKPVEGIQSSYLLFDTSIGNNKISQVVEEPTGDKIENLVWLPNNHYFYSHTITNTSAKPIYDGKVLDLKLTNDKAIAYYASPMGNWLASVERVGDAKASVQFQLRLIPTNLK